MAITTTCIRNRALISLCTGPMDKWFPGSKSHVQSMASAQQALALVFGAQPQTRTCGRSESFLNPSEGARAPFRACCIADTALP